MISPPAGVEAGMNTGTPMPSVYDEPEDMEPGLPRAKAATVKQARADMKLIDEFAKAALPETIRYATTATQMRFNIIDAKVASRVAYDIAEAMFTEHCKRELEFLERHDAD